MSKLSPEDLAQQMARHPAWQLTALWLARDIQFKTFAEAWRFMNLIAQHAEAQDHHPNWYNVYGTVQIRLSSHDADGVTERDFRLASSIDQSLTDFDYTDLPPTPFFKG